MANLTEMAGELAEEISSRQADNAMSRAYFYDILVDRVCEQDLSYAEFVNVMNMVMLQRISQGKPPKTSYWIEPTEDIYWQIRSENCERFFPDPGALTNGIQALVPSFCKKSLDGVNRILRRAHIEWQRNDLKAEGVPESLTEEQLKAICSSDDVGIPYDEGFPYSPAPTSSDETAAERGRRSIAKGAPATAPAKVSIPLAVVGLGGIAFAAVAIQLLTRDG